MPADTDVDTLLGRAIARYTLDRYLARTRAADRHAHAFGDAARLVESVLPLRTPRELVRPRGSVGKTMRASPGARGLARG